MSLTGFEGFLLGVLGAAFQEVIWWRSLRSNLASEDHSKLVASLNYWIFVVLFVLFSGFFVYLLSIDMAINSSVVAFSLGAGAPAVMKHLIRALVPLKDNDDLEFGESTFRTYLGA